MTRAKTITVALLLVLAAVASARGQTPETSAFRLLDLWQSKIALDEARARWERSRQLKDGGIISDEAYIRDTSAFESALVDLQRNAAVALDALPHVTVESAVKFQGEDGRKYVRVTLGNHAPPMVSEELLTIFTERYPGLGELSDLRGIRRIYVSLRDPGEGLTITQSAFVETARSVIVSRPYEAIVNDLAPGTTKRLTFALLRDMESVTVGIRRDAEEITRTVKLEYESSSSVQVTSLQLSQEADLGGTVTYDLMLERAAAGQQSFALAVVDLPSQIRHEFVDPSTSARLSRINFLASVASLRLGLRLHLPDTPHENVPLDSALAFAVRVIPDDGSGDGTGSQVALQLVPRGLGELVLSAPALYHEIHAEQTVVTEVLVRNSGSRRLNNIRFSTDLPVGWDATIEPRIIPDLAVNDEAKVHLTLTPSARVSRGEFSLRLRTECSTETTPLNVEDKVFRVKVLASTNVGGVALLSLLIVGLVGAVVFGAIRLARR